MAEKSELPGEPQQKFEVLMVGRIRVLKEGGQPRKKYYPQIESPVRANTYTGAFHLEGGCTKVGCIPPSAGKNEILRRG